jgi:hypothetical protein
MVRWWAREVNRQELAILPKITTETAKGFTLYMVKAVMSGRADEVLDRAQQSVARPRCGRHSARGGQEIARGDAPWVCLARNPMHNFR